LEPDNQQEQQEKIIALEATIAEMKADLDKEKPKRKKNSKRDRDPEGK
jgi:hypothetical protein